MTPSIARYATDDAFLRLLYETRSVASTARAMGMPERDALRTVMLAFGLGKVDYRLKDF